MSEHSTIGASSAYRWMTCPGSVGLSKLAPPQTSSKYAEQGTAAAWVLEMCMKDWKKFERGIANPPQAADYVGETAPNGYEILEEDATAVQSCIDVIFQKLATGRFMVHEEAKFDLSGIHPGLFGTSDIVLMESNMKRLIVIDYKHGSGIPVEVVGNKQLLYYALGAIQHVCEKHKIDYLSVLGWGSVFKEVEVMIVQPRCRHRDGVNRSWIVSGKELDSFAIQLKAAAILTTKKDPDYKAGDHCRFCPALAICPEFNRQTMEIAKADFKGVSDPVNLNLPRPEMLSKAEIAKVLRFADSISAFLAAVESHACNLLNHGEELPGFKLVQKKAHRRWRDEHEAVETLLLYLPEKDLYERSFLSPTKVEKLLGKDKKKVMQDLVITPDTGTTLAPDHDPREAIKGSALSDFTAIN